MATGDPHPAFPAPGRQSFATTHWSLVLAAGGTDSLQVRPALRHLLSQYWYPLYAFVRRKGHAQEDAFDLTQAFLAHLLETNLLGAADRTRGRFRTFLLTCLERFLRDEWEKAHRLKRGGGVRIVSLSGPEAEERYRLEPADLSTPERVFERRWALTLLQEALASLERECAAGGRAALFEAVRPLLAGEPPGAPYAELAARLGMQEGALKTAVHRLRKRYGMLLREQVAQTVAGDDEVDEELRDLFRYLG